LASQGNAAPHTSQTTLTKALPVASRSQESPKANKKKRSAPTDIPIAGPSNSQAPIHTPQTVNERRITGPYGLTWEEGANDEVEIVEAEPIDELYATIKTKVVGVQYYTGTVTLLLAWYPA
jgi:SWI/SNF-related matrix-associated actin-dependent regulator of chromatin subfamily A3